MEGDGWVYLWFSVMIILLAVFAGVCLSVSHDNEVALEQWESNEHTCPQCGWSGYPGLMKQVSHVFGDSEYYCPECGWRMK